jgi:ubiquinone/menaquinone biosynthesis C-methylase UbiE
MARIDVLRDEDDAHGRFEGTRGSGARLSEMGSDQARAVTVHQEQAGLFESRYEQYERDPYFDSFTYSRRKLEQVLAHYLDTLPDGARLLDVGCGTGNLLERLGGRFECAGCDPAEEMLRRAHTRNPGVELKVAAAEALPFEDGRFDAVLCIEVVRYLADPGPALRELARVLRPGGLALVTFTPLGTTSLYPLVNALTSRVRLPGLTHVRQHFHSVGAVERLLAGAGFGRVEVNARYFGPFIYLNRLSRPATSVLLRRWEPVDDRLARTRALRNVANLLVAAAWKPKPEATSTTSPAPR